MRDAIDQAGGVGDFHAVDADQLAADELVDGSGPARCVQLVAEPGGNHRAQRALALRPALGHAFELVTTASTWSSFDASASPLRIGMPSSDAERLERMPFDLRCAIAGQEAGVARDDVEETLSPRSPQCGRCPVREGTEALEPLPEIHVEARSPSACIFGQFDRHLGLAPTIDPDPEVLFGQRGQVLAGRSRSRSGT